MGLRDAPPVRAFREFRWSRPFWGALFVAAGGVVIGGLAVGPTDDLIHLGYGLFASEVCALLMLAMAALIMFAPSQRMIAGVVVVLLSLASFPLSNLGGFVIGMMAGIIGGSLAFGWVPDKKQFGVPAPPPSGRPRPRPGRAGSPADGAPHDHGAIDTLLTGGRP